MNSVWKKTKTKKPKAPIDYQTLNVRQTDFDVTIAQCVVSDRDLARAVLIRHKTLPDVPVKVCLLP